MTSAALSLDSLHRHFGDQQVLRGLSFEVAPGEVFALLGRNGAGKSTALRILLGFLEPHHGSASILGIDSRSLQPADRGRIGYVGEDHVLDPFLRVGDAVGFEAATQTGFDRDLALRTLSRCGIDPKKAIRVLSRGQRAQVALVLATSQRPEILVFDDPAMGLDAVMRRELLDALIDLLAETGTTVLFSSHILTDVERMADRVGILDGGALTVDATLDDLKRRVRRAIWRPRDGAPAPAEDRQILRTRPHRTGSELLLLDSDPALIERLSSAGELSEPEPLDLEQFFIHMTSAGLAPAIEPRADAPSSPSPEIAR